MQIRNISLASKNSHLLKYERDELRSEALLSEEGMVTLLIKKVFHVSVKGALLFLILRLILLVLK